MQYDFDSVVDRAHTESLKWNGIAEHFGVQEGLPLWVADMDFPSPAPVVEALTERARHGIYGYPWRSPSFYDSIVGWMARRHGWAIRPEWIANAPGVVNGLVLAVQALSSPGDKIIIQPPVYFPFYAVIRNNGRQVVENRLRVENGRYRMDLGDLEKQIDARTRILILCSPHNPVGRVWSREELEALGELCLRKDLLIFSDEIHSDLILRGHKHTPLATLSEKLAERTLTFVAPSKTFNLPGLAASAAIIPNAAWRTRFNIAAESFAVHLGNVFGIVALEAAYRHGDEWLAQLLEYVEGNVEWATQYIEEHIPRLKITRPEGTYLLWIDCRGLGLSPAALKSFMLTRARVVLNDGADFGPGGEGFCRMNLGCPRAIVREALQRIAAAVATL